MKDHYQTLGVNKNATADEIKKAHRQESKKKHPDIGGDKESFMAIQVAYETLSDGEKRRRYDNGEPEPPNIMRQAFSNVNVMLLSVIQKPGIDLFTIDIVEVMKETVNNNRLNAQNQIAEMKKSIKTIEKVISRLSHKGKSPDIMKGALDQSLQGLRAGIKSAGKDIEIMAIMDGILVDYKFQKDEPPAKVWMGMVPFAQSSDGTLYQTVGDWARAHRAGI